MVSALFPITDRRVTGSEVAENVVNPVVVASVAVIKKDNDEYSNMIMTNQITLH